MPPICGCTYDTHNFLLACFLFLQYQTGLFFTTLLFSAAIAVPPDPSAKHGVKIDKERINFSKLGHDKIQQLFNKFFLQARVSSRGVLALSKQNRAIAVTDTTKWIGKNLEELQDACEKLVAQLILPDGENAAAVDATELVKLLSYDPKERLFIDAESQLELVRRPLRSLVKIKKCEDGKLPHSPDGAGGPGGTRDSGKSPKRADINGGHGHVRGFSQPVETSAGGNG